MLNAPGFFILGRCDVGVTDIAGVGVQADIFVVGVVGGEGFSQTIWGPGLAVWIGGGGQVGEGALEIPDDQAAEEGEDPLLVVEFRVFSLRKTET